MQDILTEHFFQSILRASPGVIYIYNIEKNIAEFVSPISTDIIGYSPEELKKFGIDILSKIAHPDDLAKLKRHYEFFKSETSDQTKILEFRLSNKSKSRHENQTGWLLIHDRPLERNDKNEVTKIIGIGFEITELKNIQETLKNRNILLTNISDMSPYHTGVINIKTGIIEYSSDSLEASLGIEKVSEREGETNLFDILIKLMPQVDLVKVLAQFENFLPEGDKETNPIDFRIRDVDGNERWFQWTTMPYRISNKGEVESILSFTQEITESKINLLELKALSSELEDLIYVSSHDLQQPLNTIQSSLIILNSKLKDSENPIVRKCLTMMTETAESMKQNIKAILDYSKINSDIEFSLVDLNKVIKSVLSGLTSAIKETNATFDINETLPTINGDAQLIGLMFQNLISNALKFQKPGNSPVVTIDSEQNASHSVIHITDNGIGISKEQQSRIFTLFQRLHEDEQFEGSGIGLAHAIKIMNMHSGNLEVQSTLGSGSTFSCYFLRGL